MKKIANIFIDKIKKILNTFAEKAKKININYFNIFIVTLILSMPLISKNYFCGHDMIYHISNIESIKNDILNLNFSQISSQIAFGFGYGGAIFYPKLPHIFSALISIIIGFVGMNSIYAMKLTQIIVMFLSAIFMYKLLINVFKDKSVAMLGSVFYITMPYFITEIYVRSALNETFIFLFMPIVLLGITFLLQGKYKKFYIYFILGYLGMLTSHLVLSVYFTILLFIFLLINIKEIWNRKVISKLINASILIIIFILPVVIQMIEHKSLGIYAVFESDIMGADAGLVLNNGIALKDLFLHKVSRPYDKIYLFLNIVVILFSIIGVLRLIFKEKNKKRKKIVFGIFIFTIISIWLSSKYFPYSILPSLLLSIQFAFRCVSFVNFGISILAAYGLSIFNNNLKPIIEKVAIVMSLLIIIPFINKAEYYNINIYNYDFQAAMGHQKEYLTMAAHKNSDYLQTRDNNVKILNKSNDAKIEIIDNDIPKLEFKISNIEKNESAKLELPRLYYLGYNIILINENGEKIKLKYTNNKYGFIEIRVPENGVVKVKYTGTNLYRISLFMSIVTLFSIIVIHLKKTTTGDGKYNEKRKTI